MKKKLLVGLATGLFLVGMVGFASATSISINNNGFEDDLNLNTGNTTHGYWNSDIGSWAENNAGTWKPASFLAPLAPEGNQVAYMNGGWLYQDLVATYQENTDYTLTFQAGWRSDNSMPAYNVDFRIASSNTSVGLFTSDSFTLTQGQWELNTLTLLSTSLDSLAIGKNIRIVFEKTGGGQVNIDDIKLDSAPVPEPATMLLFGTGLAALAGSGLRRKKKA